ncbi:MAG TPA: helix-hairpin-helix domain-containing protein [Tepidisphaeraceae bacterium]|nr:helix-hairpin-helix domain-containing protein [Tepidisphaeraceae bacterium]
MALLVLMALIGTAFITTARTDRFSAQQNAFNTEIDLLVQGVVNMAEAAMTTTAHQQAGGQHWDDTRTDTWLAGRLPGSFLDACGAYVPGHTYAKGDLVIFPYDYTNPANNGSNTVYMSQMDGNMTAPNASGWSSLGTYSSFTSTIAWPAISSPLAANAMYEDPRFPLQPFPGHTASQPGIVASPTFVAFGGKTYPALQFYDPATGKITQPILAASASGDGIADSLLWRLPIGELNGVTYYAAVRIIDNNAAINLNTAFSSTVDFDYQGKALTTLQGYGLSLGIFPSNIGLTEVLKTLNPSFAASPGSLTDQTVSTEMAALNNYRFNGNARPEGIVLGTTTPTDDFGHSRADFKYNTVEEAMYMGFGRRIGNPGPVSSSALYQALSWGDAAALAYRFELANPNSSPTNSEFLLGQSLASAHTTPWNPATDTQNWYATFLGQPFGPPANANQTPNYPNYCPRSFITTRNPLNNLVPAHPIETLTSVPMQHLMLPNPNPANPLLPNGVSTTIVPRVSANTADVISTDTGLKNPTLFYGFFNAMADVLTAPNPAIYQQFRSPLRVPNGAPAGTGLNTAQMVLLRSLLASVQAQDLRDSDDNVSSRRVDMNILVNGTPTPVSVTVFGTERQPFITEVYVNNDNSAQPSENMDHSPNPNKTMFNPKGYVAVELFNPYSSQVTLTNWSLGIINRDPNAANNKYPNMKVIGIDKFASFSNINGVAVPAPTIPAGGYLVLENFPNGAAAISTDDAHYRPITNYKGVAVPTSVFYVPNLSQVLAPNPLDPAHPGGELVLLRPRNANGIAPVPQKYSSLPAPDAPLANPTFDETSKLSDLVPADAFDFAGMAQATPGATQFTAWHYVRGNDATMAPWKFVYPGRWDGTAFAPFHQEGIGLNTWDTNPQTPGQKEDLWISTPPTLATPSPNGVAAAATAPIQLGAPDITASYINNFPGIQLNNTDFGGPNKLTTTNYASHQNANLFPYGGFARVGDILQVPFIGGYTITLNDGSGTVIEMNSVTTDCAFADDKDASDDTFEQIGRFCPLTACDPKQTIPLPNGDWYGWAAHVLDYFTVIQNPHDDYLPNVDPTNYQLWDPVNSVFPPPLAGMAPPAGSSYPTWVPNLPKQTPATANMGRENLAPIEGLINVNTAPFAVLRRVPFVGVGNTSPNNDTIAQAIITYRNANGPFKTLFDLNNVPGFQSAYGDPAGTDYTAEAGDISGPSDHVLGDFEQRFMEVTRVSNLLTTRSDTYTAYILVQGWRGIGTPTPELVVQRRAAFIADRSGITATNKSLNVINVQAN